MTLGKAGSLWDRKIARRQTTIVSTLQPYRNLQLGSRPELTTPDRLESLDCGHNLTGQRFTSVGYDMDQISADSRPPGEQPGTPARRKPRHRARLGLAAVIILAGGAWLAYAQHASQAAEHAAPPPPPLVIVSRPLARDLDRRLGFLGQFSAVDQVELRAQVGGILTGIHFRDGDIVHQGDLLFTIDPVPYDIRLAQANATLQSAKARLDLANRELVRARSLKRSDAGTSENVDQRLSEQQAAEAGVSSANAQVRDARFDLDHCRITAPLTGRIGSHLVSVGNLIGGSRVANGSTTLLATIVSVDPIYLNFDMSEADYLPSPVHMPGGQAGLRTR
jgi:multidrug efflux system membrane fusion protein